MKPSRTQIFFAKNMPLKIWRLSCILAGIVILLYNLPMKGFELDAKAVIFFIGLALVAGIVGFFISLIFSFVLLPIYSLGARLNGAPFHENEDVYIMVGTHKGESAKIYEIWEERWQVRVYLGEKEKELFTDVFSYTEVFKTLK